MPKLSDEHYMRLALAQAQTALQQNEVPVGAILVGPDGQVLAAAHNLREQTADATAHAEILAIRQACGQLNHWRLTDTTLYVTLEPCPMCAGAIMLSRIKRLVYGCSDSKSGGVHSLFNIVTHPYINHYTNVTAGVLEEECKEILQNFFRLRR